MGMGQMPEHMQDFNNPMNRAVGEEGQVDDYGEQDDDEYYGEDEEEDDGDQDY